MSSEPNITRTSGDLTISLTPDGLRMEIKGQLNITIPHDKIAAFEALIKEANESSSCGLRN